MEQYNSNMKLGPHNRQRRSLDTNPSGQQKPEKDDVTIRFSPKSRSHGRFTEKEVLKRYYSADGVPNLLLQKKMLELYQDEPTNLVKGICFCSDCGEVNKASSSRCSSCGFENFQKFREVPTPYWITHRWLINLRARLLSEIIMYLFILAVSIGIIIWGWTFDQRSHPDVPKVLIEIVTFAALVIGTMFSGIWIVEVYKKSQEFIKTFKLLTKGKTK